MKHWSQETATERAERYLRENRSVSGGDVNPPGKPGYVVVTLEEDDAQATQQLNDLEAQGYELRFFSNGRAILDNYKK